MAFRSVITALLPSTSTFSALFSITSSFNSTSQLASSFDTSPSATFDSLQRSENSTRTELVSLQSLPTIVSSLSTVLDSSSSTITTELGTLSSPLLTISSTTSGVSGTAVVLKDTSLELMEKLAPLLREEGVSSIFSKGFLQTYKSPSKLQAYFDNQAQNMRAQNVGVMDYFMQGEAKKRTKSNCYIIRIREESPEDVFKHLQQILGHLEGNVRRTYRDGISGFSVCFPDGVLPLDLIKSIPWTMYVERDQYFGVAQVQSNAPWGLARISEPTNMNGDKFSFNLTGEGVTIYTIDSGIWMLHKEFGNRGKIAYSIFGMGINFDCSGHGTEVASAAAGLNVGIAKKAAIQSCQVLDCEGQGQNSDLVDALSWILRNAKRPAVVNMSVGGPSSQSVDDAVAAVVNQGIPVVVAAGNSATDACTQSPSRVASAIVVGASTEYNERANFSNYGRCVEIFAPGANIYAAAIPKKSPDGYTYVSGTSLSSPFVAGVVALRLEQFPYATPMEVKTWILGMAAKGALKSSSLYDSPNILLRLMASPSIDLVNFQEPKKPGEEKQNSSIMLLVFIIIGGVIAGLCLLGLLFLSVKAIRRRIQRRNRTAVNGNGSMKPSTAGNLQSSTVAFL